MIVIEDNNLVNILYKFSKLDMELSIFKDPIYSDYIKWKIMRNTSREVRSIISNYHVI